MTEREQVKSTSQFHDEETVSDLKVTNAQTGRTDELLDEIDAVLEKNAAEFVKGFVQKGGQ